MIDLTEALCRYEARAALFPPGARCGICGVADPLVLIIGRRPIVCATCSARERGVSGYEWHHVGGRPSPLEPVWITVNTHRLLTLAQDVAWRGLFAPGSRPAVAIDLVFLNTFTKEASDDQ